MIEFGHYPGCSTHSLDAPLPDTRIYQSAFVFPLPPHVERIVYNIRSRVPVGAPPDDQLKPHITLLYLGIYPGIFLSALLEELGEIAPRLATEVWCSGTGEFSISHTSKNWHLTIEPSATLRDMQGAVAERCMSRGWAVASRFMADRYTPHVTIWDHIAMPARSFSLPAEVDLTELKFAIESPMVVGRAVG